MTSFISTDVLPALAKIARLLTILQAQFFPTCDPQQASITFLWSSQSMCHTQCCSRTNPAVAICHASLDIDFRVEVTFLQSATSLRFGIAM